MSPQVSTKNVCCLFQVCLSIKNPALTCQEGQRVELCTKDLQKAFLHQFEAFEGCNLALHFIGPLPISKMINPLAIRLPRTLRVCPTFLVFLILIDFYTAILLCK
ncbi:hypothetical protein ILYODFUR_029619 [Ilyodon furcidens]|uniref:Uncharacterized protein n=1 Tax=Ilyodon furcidens TaxID=33524 RepID=A0ABV0V061_9TELE